jgi:hypothetical protein
MAAQSKLNQESVGELGMQGLNQQAAMMTGTTTARGACFASRVMWDVGITETPP